MRHGARRTGMLLLETLVGLALLALLGVWLIQLQAAALRQWSAARQLERATREMNALLARWSETGEAVTVPGQGMITDSLIWERACAPTLAGELGMATQVTVVLSTPPPQARDVLSVSWLVPESQRGR